jgi:amino acid transporter, AAT family
MDKEPEPIGVCDELTRRLTERQLTMITIGGAIGVGLFLGSSVTMSLAGPGVILSYLLGACVALIVTYAITEMAVVHPVAGSFGVYADAYLNRWAGFTVRTTYALVQMIAIGAEITAISIYFGFWFPSVPAWMCVGGVSIALIALNAAQVSKFAEVEYWFALIKVMAIVLFVVVGLGLIFGIGSTHAIGFSNLTANGGFLPHGLKGVWLALTLTLTSYMGIEIIGVTAGEAKEPERTIPRAMRTIAFRLILFYILATIVMLAMTSWSQMNSGITGSPFVKAFAAAHIPYAASVMNLVVITAALSSANTNLYLTSRTLFSLARGRYAPKALGQLSKNGVPHAALAVSALGMVAAILFAVFAPSNAFLLLYGVAVAGMYFVWIVILFSHLRFRKALGPERVSRLPMRLPFFPWTTIAGIVLVTAITLSTFAVPGLRYSVPAFLPFLLLMSIAYWRLQKRAAGGEEV